MEQTTSYSLSEAFGFLSKNEIDFIKKLSNMLKENPIIINIGAGAGTSALAFLEARDDSTIITIDKTKQSSPYGSLEGEMNAINNSKFAGTIRLKQINIDSKDTTELAASIIDIYKRCDLVFIDGDHTYEGCSSDIEIWLYPLLYNKNRGRISIIAFHDYDHKEYPGVRKAIESKLYGFKQIDLVDTLIAFYV